MAGLVQKPTLHLTSQSGTGTATAITAARLSGALVIVMKTGTVTDFDIQTNATGASAATAQARTFQNVAVDLDGLSANAMYILTPDVGDEITVEIVTGTGVVYLLVIEAVDLAAYMLEVSENARAS